MDMTRRTLLKNLGGSGVLAAALAAGILRPTGAWAGDWNKAAFEARDAAAAARNIGAAATAENRDLLLKVPDIAENGAVVNVDVTSNIPNTVSIAVLVDKNPLPLAAVFNFANGAVAEVSMPLKIGQTGNVKAIAKTADGKFYAVQREVKVTIGDCGEPSLPATKKKRKS